MPSLLADLARHQRVGNTTPAEYGKMDCCLWAADWVHQQIGIDPAARWRGQYSTEGEFLRLLAAEGGLVRVVARAMARLGLRRIAPVEAESGDIGIIVTERGPACAIRGQLAWLAKTGDQVATVADASFAWRLR